MFSKSHYALSSYLTCIVCRLQKWYENVIILVFCTMIRVHKSLDVWVRRFAHNGLAATGGEEDSFKPNLVNRVKIRPVCEVYNLS